MGEPMKADWSPVDPLGEALHFLRMRGTFYSRCEFSAPWGLVLPPIDDCWMFHVVTAGECWIEVGPGETKLLRPGLLAVVPRGDGHRLASAPDVAGAKLFDLPRVQVSERYEVLRQHGGGAAVGLVCGAVRFEHPAAERLRALLPKLLLADAGVGPQSEWLQSTLRLMGAEAGALRPGGETIVTRLADILVIQAIRSWIEGDGAAQSGWLAALRDPQIGRAMALVHRDPARAWTVASLASAVAMSRSAFAARFTDFVGEPAMRYLARWRMQVAAARLRDEAVPLGELAGGLGYDSEASFSRAFKRVVGVAPGSLRKRGGASPALSGGGALPERSRS